MRTASGIARYLAGVIFLVFGLNGFLHFIPLPPPAGVAGQFVDARDGHAGAIYNATGPERLSGAERAALIAEITGRPLAFRVISEEQLRTGLTQAGLPLGGVNAV